MSGLPDPRVFCHPTAPPSRRLATRAATIVAVAVTVTTLGYAILGLLAREPLSGYDVARRLRRPIGYYWTARHSQIYPELRRLTADRLARSSEAEGVRRRREYSITRAGRAELQAWVGRAPSEHQPRDEVCLKAYSLWVVEAESAITLLGQLKQAHQARLVEYEAMLSSLKHNRQTELLREGTRSPAFGNYATLRRGIGYEREYLGWLRWLIRQLKDPRALTRN